MKIIAPMAGTGQRFVDSGYKEPKPLIEVNGKKIIQYIIEMFSPDDDFVFICNEKHLSETNMKDVLQELCPDSVGKLSLHTVTTHIFGIERISFVISERKTWTVVLFLILVSIHIH